VLRALLVFGAVGAGAARLDVGITLIGRVLAGRFGLWIARRLA
jgi:hypothetical protein